MRILLIENDSSTRQSLELMLRAESFNVFSTDSGEEAMSLGKRYDYDAIILNLSLPDRSGLAIIRDLRFGGCGTPIIAIEHDADPDVIVHALDIGADDHVTIPFHDDELVARIRAIVRRSKGHATNIVRAGDLTVNIDAKTVEFHGQRVPLTVKEYEMIELLALRKGSTVTKDMFLNHLYGGMDEPEPKIIDVYTCKLRKKLRAAGCNAVKTVWGRGLILGEQETPLERPELRDMTSPPLVPV